MKKYAITTAVAATTLLISSMAAQSAEPEACRDVEMANVNWTGVSVKSNLMKDMLEALGYNVTLTTGSVPIAFQAVADGEKDFFLGLWLPSQQGMIQPFLEEGTVEKVRANLEGTKYTLAVPTYVHEAGVTQFEDLDAHKDKFGGEIFGIEAGNEGNVFINNMIEDDTYGLGDWTLMPSSEAGMLTEVKRAVSRDEWVVYLGWAPHPMTRNIDMEFLEGGEQYFGQDQGGGSVYTIATKGYVEECPNVGRLLEQFQLSVDDQSLMGDYVLNQNMDYAPAGRVFVENRPARLAEWFEGVKTADGDRDALAVVEQEFGLGD